MLARLLVQPAIIIEGGLEVKLPTMCTDEKQRWEEPERVGGWVGRCLPDCSSNRL